MQHIALRVSSGLLTATWCTAAYAATGGEPFGHQLGQIPVSSYLLVILLAGIPGAFGVLGKLKRGEIALGPAAWWSVLYELVGSIIAGYLAFFSCEAVRLTGAAMPDVAQVLAIATFGYGGSRMVDRWFTKRGDDLVDNGVKGGA